MYKAREIVLHLKIRRLTLQGEHFYLYRIFISKITCVNSY